MDLRTTFRLGAHVQALLEGRVTSDLLKLQFTAVEPISRAFRRALRDNEFDVTEMALVTLAMAVDAGHPWVGLPVVVMRGFHHGALRTLVESRINRPSDLIGRKVGVRAYSQTTGVWVRGILLEEYGVRSDQIRWITTEDAHVAGFSDPAYVSRAPSDASLRSLLSAGEIAAVIGDASSSFGNTRPVIVNADLVATSWRQRTGVYPVNHVIALRRDLLRREPWLASELQQMFQRSRDLWLSSASAPPADDLPYGRQEHERSIDAGLSFAFAQGLTSRLFRYEDLFCC